ncbi:MAG TPA: MmcQ/YjbR family DNA-binding protein [Stellaceae bacterium]|nr:MmcQ/YjbR family DNA-binding protein [Stellaceae bacterium]
MPRATRKKKKRKTPLDRLREICLALPEAEERETWECPTFRVRDKIYAMYVEDEDDRPGIWCKAPPGNQTHLVEADPERFFVPPYVGHKGWIGMHLDRRVTWREVAVVVERSYRLTAPTKLLKGLESVSAVPKRKPRGLGFWKGKVWIADDFGALMPEDIQAAFEERDGGKTR